MNKSPQAAGASRPRHPPRGPAALGAARRPAGLRLFLFALLALVVASFATLDLQWRAFFSAEAASSMGRFAAEFWPPQPVPKLALAAAETFAMSLLGTLLAALLGLLLALPASRHGAPRGAARVLLNALRAVPELVWAALLLILAGLGPFAGTLALAVHTAGVLGRLFAEALENAPRAAADALRVQGASPVQVFLYATLPTVAPQLLSYALYRWENNIRAAAVIGVVGAGGLGQLLAFHLSLFHMGKVATVLVAMLALVAAVDLLSYLTRRWMTR